MILRRCARLLVVLVAASTVVAWPLALPAGGATAAELRQREAETLARRARQHLQRGRLEDRRQAVVELERATLLAPANPEYQLLLARAYWRSGYRRAAMKRFERVIALEPRSADARYGLGQVWRRDWLKYLEKSSLEQSIRELVEAVRIDSTHTDSWLMLSSLLVARGDSLRALGAANSALAVAPDRLEAQVARAACLWRVGEAELADAEFRAVIPRLERPVRERFEDIAPVASERDTAIYNHLGAPERREFARQFWTEHDPDLATPMNEAQLEYWARVTQAYFLFYDAKHREWDERGEVYVRYGPPEGTEYNPLGTYLYSKGAQSAQMQFPMNVLVWKYPGLGMTVTMQDRVLSEYYLLPVSYDRDMDPRPQPDSIGARDALGTHESRGVFPTLPPGVKRLPLRTDLARFVAGESPQLFAAVEAALRPGEEARAEFVVLDSLQREVARVRGTLSPSACGADSMRVADFSVPLPPGRYTAGFTVQAGARRGTTRSAFAVVPPPAGLGLSDLVITCGAPALPEPNVRLNANPSARVANAAPLTAYFEVYGLVPQPDGLARFEYSYHVRSAGRDRRIWVQRLLQGAAAAADLNGTWRGEHAGALRRQFVSVPVAELPPGPYVLEVRVRDLVSGDEAAREAEFTRLPEPAR